LVDYNTIGVIAGALTTAAYAPQVLKVWKSKSAKDISMPTFLMLSAGTLLWFFYGIGIGSLPVMAANAITLILVAAVAVMKLVYK